MPDPVELLHAWEAAIREIGSAAGSLVVGSASAAGQFGAPLQRQAELLEQVLRRELVERLLAPAHTILDVADQTTSAMHAQATAFRAAATSLAQVADLLEQQAELLHRASGTIRDPIAALRSAGAALRDEQGGKDAHSDS
jgi:hypothetical protein